MKRWWFVMIALTGLGQDVQERLSVTLRNVRVHVLDGDDRPVTGLTQKDFIVLENRKKQDISFFEAISLPRSAQVSSEAKEGVLKVAETPATMDRTGVKPSEQRAIIIFVDTSNMTRAAYQAATTSLRRFLQTGIRANDRVKLVQYDVDLKQMTAFTNSPEVLTEGLGRLRYKAAYRRKLSSMNMSILGTIAAIETTSSDEGERKLKQLLYEKGQFVASTYKGHLLSLTSMARILAQVPGERSILLFSGTGYRDNNGDIGDLDVEKIAEEMAATLNTADVTIYSAIRNEPEPVFGNSVDGSANSDVDTGDVGQNTIKRKDRRDNVSSGEDQLYKYQKKNISGILKPFAEISARETGGIYTHIYNWRDLDRALDGFDEHSRSFYKLGYLRDNPTAMGKVKIKLAKGKGRRSWRLLYGKEFVPKLPYAEMNNQDRTVTREGLLLFGLESMTDLEAQWEFLVFRDPLRGYRIAVSGLVPNSADSKGLELAFAALNRDGEPLDMTDITITKERGTALAPFYDVLFTRELPYKLRFYARDLSTEEVNLHTQSVRDRIRFPILLSDLVLAQPELMFANSLNKPIPGKNNRLTMKRMKRDPFHFDDVRLQPLPIGRLDASKSVGAYFHFYHEGELGKGYRVRFLFHEGDKTRLISHQIARVSLVEPGTYGFLCVLDLPALAAQNASLELVLTTPEGKDLRRVRNVTTILPK